jgi:AcrR family transcriptional regulator
MAPRDAEATRRRLIDAAAAEFAELGIAGARVDRIAAAAQTNKAQIYHYFDNKDGLFSAVLAGLLEHVVESDPFDADDLPESMGRIFDQFEDDPSLARLATWYRLERSDDDPPHPAIIEANAAKVAAIRAAQRDGRVTDAFAADVLLGLLVSLATTWASLPPEYTPAARNNTRPKRRAAVVEAARRLVAPE